MKKNIAIILMLVFSVSLFAQRRTNVKKGPFIENDTTVLYRHTEFDDEGTEFTVKAYIDTDRNSNDFKCYTGMVFNDWDKQNFEENMQWLKQQHPQPFQKHIFPENFPCNWIPIESYQGKYYLYDMTSCYWHKFTDSLYIINGMEVLLYIIESCEEISPTHYRVKVNDLYNKTLDNIDFYIIDTERKIAVMANGYYKSLVIAQETASMLDLIVWITGDMPDDDDIGFDKIDYNKLLDDFQSK
jgi:hypothetical protein